jgi:cell division transport system ATP-binding protein
MIRLENVSKMYGSELPAVRDASFDVPKGEFVFLVARPALASRLFCV